ncbi:MAG: hypothetical protein EOP85_11670 [Verrucomicrobiaceae bacterium]|nr:MAG: hypothetical protein EOP85_11670 [Verrucomicrobiaceae bacterium]
MKSIISKFIAAAVAISATGIAIPKAEAAKIRLEGFGFYEVANKVRYFATPPKQGGRFYRFKGGDYYHKAEIGVDYMVNRSNSRSGDLSFEFWAMPFYGSTNGIILMTTSVGSLKARKQASDVDEDGQAIDLNRRRFPELNVWEYTRSGWKFRDALSFDYKAWL